jgi:hypothetical protein
LLKYSRISCELGITGFHVESLDNNATKATILSRRKWEQVFRLAARLTHSTKAFRAIVLWSGNLNDFLDNSLWKLISSYVKHSGAYWNIEREFQVEIIPYMINLWGDFANFLRSSISDLFNLGHGRLAITGWWCARRAMASIPNVSILWGVYVRNHQQCLSLQAILLIDVNQTLCGQINQKWNLKFLPFPPKCCLGV